MIALPRVCAAAAGLAVVVGLARATDPAPERPGPAAEAPLPAGAKARFGPARMAISTHTLFALGPEFRTLVLTGGWGCTDLRDAATTRLAKQFAPDRRPDSLTPVAVSADGKRVFIGHWNSQQITVGDTRTGEKLGALSRPVGVTTLTPLSGRQKMLSVSVDGKVAAFGGKAPARGKVVKAVDVVATVLDVDNNKELARVAVNQTADLVCALSPDGKSLATWAAVHYPFLLTPGPSEHDPELAHLIRVWDVATGKERTRVRTVAPQPVEVVFSPDGALLAACTGEGTVEWWDAQTGTRKPHLTGANGQRVLAFAPDGGTLAALGADAIIRRWSAADGRFRGAFVPPAELFRFQPHGIGFATPDRVVAWGRTGGVAVAWDGPPGRFLTPLPEHVLPITSLGFAAGGKELVTSAADGRVVRWDVATARPLGPVAVPADDAGVLLGLKPQYTGLRLSTDATRGMWGDRDRKVYDLGTGKAVFAVPAGPPGTVVTRTFLSPDLSRVAVVDLPQIGSNDSPRTSHHWDVWDVRTARRTARLEMTSETGFYYSGFNAAFSPDGSKLVTVIAHSPPKPVQGQERKIVYPTVVVTGWDLATGRKLAEVADSDTGANGLVAAANDTSAVMVGGTGRVWAVDYAGGKLGDELERGGRGHGASCAAVFSTDGTRFAAGVFLEPGKVGVRVYDWPRGTTLHTFVGHTEPVTALAFSPDGKFLASGSADASVLLWDLTAKAE